MDIFRGIFLALTTALILGYIEGIVKITTKPRILTLEYNAKTVSYKVECSAEGNGSNPNVSSIKLTHQTGGFVSFSSTNSTPKRTGIFNSASISPFNLTSLTASFNDVNASIHFGLFNCSVSLQNVTVPEEATASLQQIRIPEVNVSKPQSGVGVYTIGCKVKSACFTGYTVETDVKYANDTFGNILNKADNTNRTSYNCGLIEKVYYGSYTTTDCDVGQAFHYYCSVSWVANNRTRRSARSKRLSNDVTYIYSPTVTTVVGQKYKETCTTTDSCITEAAVCGTQTTGTLVCECASGNVYDKDNDRCSNVVPCPQDETYIYFHEENSCYTLKPACENCSYWGDYCTEPDAEGIALTKTVRDHLFQRVWKYGFYSWSFYSQLQQTFANENQTTLKTFSIVLSTNYTTDAWFWPNGQRINNAPSSSRGCLYILYNGPDSPYSVKDNCNFSDTEVYTGCFIQLPSKFCETHTDDKGYTWIYTEGGTLLNTTCPVHYSGLVTRECTVQGVFKPPFYNCTLAALKEIKEELDNTTTDIVLTNLRNVLLPPSNNTDSFNTTNTTVTLYIGDLLTIQSILKTVVNKTNAAQNETDDFLEIASDVLDEVKHGAEWESRIETEDKGAEEFIAVVDEFISKATETLKENNYTSVNITKPNIVLQFATVKPNSTVPQDIHFPTELAKDPRWNTSSVSSMHLQFEAFADKGVQAYSVVLYKNLSRSVPHRLLQGDTQKQEDIAINSQVISVQMLPKAPDILDPEIEFVFQAFQDISTSVAYCSFWNISANSGNGTWDTHGCHQTYANSTVVMCACNHLTNFALLISPHVPSEIHAKVLGIISVIGCSISILAMIVTVALHALHWRLVKSEQSILLVSLCVVLIACNAIFIGGVTQTANKSMCTAVAVVLHYLFLVAFFLMLAEGVRVFIKIVFVFNKSSFIFHMLFVAFGIPAAIVAISAGLTKLEGYGDNNYCWLSRQTWLFWAFAGPVCLVIALNFLVIGLLVKTMCGRSRGSDKTLKTKARQTAMALAVIVPVMGVGWIAGLLSVNEDFLWLQYIFCIFNSLQGLFILIFHTLRSRELKKAIQASKKRKQTMDEISKETSQKQFLTELKGKIKTHFTKMMKASSSTGTLMSDTKETSFDTSVKPIPSNDFLYGIEEDNYERLEDDIEVEIYARVEEDVSHGCLEHDKNDSSHFKRVSISDDEDDQTSGIEFWSIRSQHSNPVYGCEPAKDVSVAEEGDTSAEVINDKGQNQD